MSSPSRVLLRLRVGAEHAHYGGGVVDGAYVLKLFGDAATELLIRHDGDEGLFRAYSSVEFTAPVVGGDYLEIELADSNTPFVERVVRIARGVGREPAPIEKAREMLRLNHAA